MNNKVKQMNDLTSNDDLYLDRDRYSKDNVYKNMLNDEFTELLKEAKEVEKKTPKGNQNTVLSFKNLLTESCICHVYLMLDFLRSL